ncbi:hypothetical protein [Sphingomonas sp. BK580]|uniref:hypothetical protein n=1 Tax=Sphingomonas sp. BK580 TaxID=2586972 RepID=UPI00160CB72D|nr:hypothetical protein [Sphingomonas sp. BK580]MBB3693030.1 hypothetical protein [Sphingomonas sp. BK580]
MPELNTTQSVEMFDEDGFDTLTVVDMGEGIFALSQLAEDGTFHNNVIGPEQAERLIKHLIKVMG